MQCVYIRIISYSLQALLVNVGYVQPSHLYRDECIFSQVYFVCMPGVDVGYLHRPVEEGAHVAIVGLVHLLQEAAVLLLRFVAYQTLQHHS